MLSEVNPDIAAMYNDSSNSYPKFAQASFSWHYIEKPAFDRHLANFYKSDTRTLDAGCGSGRVVTHLIEKGIDGRNITAVDKSSTLIDLASSKLPQVNFIMADLTDITLCPSDFKLITSTMVFHYLDEAGLEKVLTNFHTWLDKDGVLFYMCPHPIRIIQGDLPEYQRSGWRMEHTPWGSDIPVFHRTTAELINKTINAGFAIEAVDEPPVELEGRDYDEEEYLRYTSYGASRLAVKARKQ